MKWPKQHLYSKILPEKTGNDLLNNWELC